jgi:hypothetical protein
MSRRIVFAGGTQTRALARIYRGEIAAETGDDVVFIGAGAAGTDAARSALLLADLIALEIDEDGDSLPSSEMPSTAEIVRVPNLYCDYLWPFAGRSHPKNRGNFIIPGGPFPAEHGDRFLDQMVAEGVDEDEAIRRYLAVDIIKEGELDSRLEDRMGIQQRLDGASGFDIAGYIAENFRAQPLFRTRQRITMPLLRRLVRQLLPKLGVRGFDVERIKRVPFPAGAQPIHPGVAAHFALAWSGAGQRFPLNQEGYFTFEAFCRRYMQFAWNETLHRGIETARSQPGDALADLERGLADSPQSPLGLRALALARFAVGLEPNQPPPTVLDEDSYNPAEDPLPAPPSAPATAPEGRAAAAPAPPTDAAVAATAEAAPEAAAEVPADAPAEIGAPDAAATPVAAPEAAAAGSVADDHASAEDDALEALRTHFPPPATEPAAPGEAPPQGERAFRNTQEGFTDFGPPPAREPAKEKTKEKAKDKAKDNAKVGAAEPAAANAYGTTQDGFTDFGPPPGREPKEKVESAALAAPGSELIDVLPRLLPVFNDLSGASDRPFSAMPEIMPPPPLRPILPPELQNDPPKQGFLSRMLGRKQT